MLEVVADELTVVADAGEVEVVVEDKGVEEEERTEGEPGKLICSTLSLVEFKHLKQIWKFLTFLNFQNILRIE